VRREEEAIHRRGVAEQTGRVRRRCRIFFNPLGVLGGDFASALVML